MTSLNEIQTAVYAALKKDVTLMGMITGVFDFVQTGQPMPYITIGEATEVPFNTLGRRGREVTITLHVWSAYKGYSQALGIFDRMNQVLDGVQIPITGLSLVYIEFENSQTLMEVDSATNTQVRHIPARYRVVVQE